MVGGENGGCIVDYHSSDFFPERYFDLVLCLRCNNTILYDRLEARGYAQGKIQENIECEIMQVVLDEARESYAQDIVIELQNDTVDDAENNIDRVRQWIDHWLANKRNEEMQA